MDIAIAVMIGIGSGLIASIAFWLLQFRMIRPSLEVAPTIAKYMNRSGRMTYQIKFRNASRRDAYDVKTVMRCNMTSLIVEGAQEVIALEEWNRLVFGKGRWLQITLHLERMPDRSKGNYLQYFPQAIRERIERGDYVDLEEFLKMRDDTVLILNVSGTDSLSGARQVVEQRYTLRDIRIGPFLTKSFEHSGQLDRSVNAASTKGAASAAEDPNDSPPS